MLEIESVITNGYVDISTIEEFAKRGFTFVTTVPAFPSHPYAFPTDKLSIFAKYTENIPIDSDKQANIPLDIINTPVNIGPPIPPEILENQSNKSS